jgi:hypothetical protein
VPGSISPFAMAWQNIAAIVRCFVLPVGSADSSFSTTPASSRSGVGRCAARTRRMASADHAFMIQR